MHSIPVVKNVVFDLGGVILPIEFSRTIEALEQAGIKDAGAQFNLGHANSVFKDYEEGLISDEEFLAALAKRSEAGADTDMLRSAWNALLLDFPPERIELLGQLGKNYDLYLFSNTNGIHHAAFHAKFEQAFGKPFDGLFKKVWYSHLIRKRKPDVDAFEWILADGDLLPQETLFIDDALNNVEGAQQAGLHGFHLTGGTTVNDLDWKL